MMMHYTDMTYQPKQYNDHTHPDAFVDWKRQVPYFTFNKECHICKGHGGWNLELNAYSLPAGWADTAENRHKFVHFRTVCPHCNGWGFVDQKETCVGHEWAFENNLGNCYNRYRCVHCGKHNDVDSSD